MPANTTSADVVPTKVSMEFALMIGAFVKTNTMELAEFVCVSGTSISELIRFTSEISWMKKISSNLRFYHGNEIFVEAKEYATESWLTTCIDITMQEADRVINHYKINERSSLSIEVSAKIELIPYYSTHDPKLADSLSFTKAPNSWLIVNPDTNVENWKQLKSQIICKKILWSSKQPRDAAEVAINYFKKRSDEIRNYAD